MVDRPSSYYRWSLQVTNSSFCVITIIVCLLLCNLRFLYAWRGGWTHDHRIKSPALYRTELVRQKIVLVLYYSDSWFRSRDLWVMGPTRCLCAKSLLKVSPGFEPGFQDSKSWVITPTLWDHLLLSYPTLIQTTLGWKRALPLSYPIFNRGWIRTTDHVLISAIK